MKLVVGLGNPERKYQGTRHNIGFEVLAELARRHAVGKVKAKFHGEIVEASVAGEKVTLLSPLTYMNRSGMSVAEAVRFFKVESLDLLVVCDDFNLPLAKLRFRAKGSAGGQKGIGDIILRLGTEEFPRLRIGIGEPPPRWDAADYVLSKFKKEEIPEMEEAVRRAADAVAVWVDQGIDACMNQFN